MARAFTKTVISVAPQGEAGIPLILARARKDEIPALRFAWPVMTDGGIRGRHGCLSKLDTRPDDIPALKISHRTLRAFQGVTLWRAKKKRDPVRPRFSNRIRRTAGICHAQVKPEGALHPPPPVEENPPPPEPELAANALNCRVTFSEPHS